MTIMRDVEIISSVMKGEIIVDPFISEHVQAASYDLCLGEQAYVSGKERGINIREHSGLELKPGQFAVVITDERIRLPSDVSADIGISSYWTRKGLLLLHGPQIDPGFEGRLVFGLYNASTRPREVTFLIKEVALFGILSNLQISNAINEGNIGIRPFNEEALQASSYDVAIAGQVELRIDGGYSAHPESETINPHQFAAFVSQEYLALSNDIVVHIYMRSRYARLGLLPVNEGRIEVGWKGQMILEFYNATDHPITVKPGDRLVTIEFVRLAEKPSQGYHGIFQNQSFKEYQPLEWPNVVRKIEKIVLDDERLQSNTQSLETQSIAKSFLSNLRWTIILQESNEAIILGYSEAIVEHIGLTPEAEKIIANIVADAINKVTQKQLTVTLRPI